MDKAAARAGVGKATVYRRWASRAELAAEALSHAGLTDDVVPVTTGTGSGTARVREELFATLHNVTAGAETSRVDLVSALHDTARQEPELCSLIRVRYVDSLQQALTGVPERGDLLPRPTRPHGQHAIAVCAAIALLIHWGVVHDHPISDGDIAQIVDGVLMPLL